MLHYYILKLENLFLYRCVKRIVHVTKQALVSVVSVKFEAYLGGHVHTKFDLTSNPVLDFSHLKHLGILRLKIMN